jgi:hypothetical protein
MVGKTPGFCPVRRLLFALILSTLVQAEADAAPATQLAVSNDPCSIQVCPPGPRRPPPKVVVSGEPFGIYVAARDAANSRDIGYVGTVSFASSDSAATLPLLYTFVPTDEGGRGFMVTLRTAGQQTITVTDAGGTLAPGFLTMTVTGPGLGIEIPTLTVWMQLALALLLGLAGIWVFRLAK